MAADGEEENKGDLSYEICLEHPSILSRALFNVRKFIILPHVLPHVRLLPLHPKPHHSPVFTASALALNAVLVTLDIALQNSGWHILLPYEKLKTVTPLDTGTACLRRTHIYYVIIGKALQFKRGQL